MPTPTWDDHYREGFLPWDTGVPEPVLVQALEAGTLGGERALEIGCGTGTNARHLAAAGFRVVALDLSPTAVARAREQAGSEAVTYHQHDILAAPAPGAPYDLVFDRGCFHVFDADEDRARFAARVAEALRPGGLWLSLIGSTEGPPREVGPPRRTAREILAAVEPVLEVLSLQASAFAASSQAAAWRGLFRKRELPAQPSTRR